MARDPHRSAESAATRLTATSHRGSARFITSGSVMSPRIVLTCVPWLNRSSTAARSGSPVRHLLRLGRRIPVEINEHERARSIMGPANEHDRLDHDAWGGAPQLEFSTHTTDHHQVRAPGWPASSVAEHLSNIWGETRSGASVRGQEPIEQLIHYPMDVKAERGYLSIGINSASRVCSVDFY
jgi:hypothetical protein